MIGGQFDRESSFVPPTTEFTENQHNFVDKCNALGVQAFFSIFSPLFLSIFISWHFILICAFMLGLLFPQLLFDLIQRENEFNLFFFGQIFVHTIGTCRSN